MPGTATPPAVIDRIRTMRAGGASISDTARKCGVDRHTVRRYSPTPAAVVGVPTLPPAAHEAAAPAVELPPSQAEGFDRFQLDTPGSWLVLGDVHVPHHDRPTLEAAVAEAHRRGVVGVILNGDTLDCHEISTHDKDPKASRYVDEIATGKQFLAWLRAKLPKARIVYKEGNHEERLTRYILSRAPALFGVDGVNLSAMLALADYDIEWVGDRRVIGLGKLSVVHGHEYRGGGGVSPARWLYLRARSVAMCGHFHRVSEHQERDIRGRASGAWSVGCACHLSPRYAPLNDWSHGYAIVEVGSDGWFRVDNRRVLAGKVA